MNLDKRMIQHVYDYVLKTEQNLESMTTEEIRQCLNDVMDELTDLSDELIPNV